MLQQEQPEDFVVGAFLQRAQEWGIIVVQSFEW